MWRCNVISRLNENLVSKINDGRRNEVYSECMSNFEGM